MHLYPNNVPTRAVQSMHTDRAPTVCIELRGMVKNVNCTSGVLLKRDWQGYSIWSSKTRWRTTDRTRNFGSTSCFGMNKRINKPLYSFPAEYTECTGNFFTRWTVKRCTHTRRPQSKLFIRQINIELREHVCASLESSSQYFAEYLIIQHMPASTNDRFNSKCNLN